MELSVQTSLVSSGLNPVEVAQGVFEQPLLVTDGGDFLVDDNGDNLIPADPA